jgi:hypothetical protein
MFCSSLKAMGLTLYLCGLRGMLVTGGSHGGDNYIE